jgi:hypothetical protein
MIHNQDSLGGVRREFKETTNAMFLNAAMIKENKNIPSVVRELEPHSIAIMDDRLVILFTTLPRNVLLVFSESAEQWGAKKLADGVWYSN